MLNYKYYLPTINAYSKSQSSRKAIEKIEKVHHLCSALNLAHALTAF